MNYYVSKSGLNSNSGLTINESVLTINQAVTLASSGDTIYIREGYYSEYINLSKSGLTFLPYQEENPVISAYDAILNNSWVLHEPGIYKAQLDSTWNIGLGKNDVYSTSMELQEARWPKLPNRLEVTRETCAISTDGNTDTSAPIDAQNNYLGYYTHPDLASLPNMTGAKVLMAPGYEWWLRHGDIESHVGNTINIKYKYTGSINSTTDMLAPDDPFILWNKYELLTQELDYFFDTATNILYVKSSVAPTDVYMRKRDRVLNLDSTNTIFKYIKLIGRVETSSNSINVLLDNIEIVKGYKDWLLGSNRGALDLRGTSNTFINSRLYDTGGALINIYGSGHILKNNILHNDGYAGSSTGVQAWGASDITFTRNTIYDTAGVAIAAMAKSSEYSFNHTYNVGRLLTDLAAINAWNSGDAQGTVIKWNHIHDVVSYMDSAGGHWGGIGIRLDSGGAPLGCSNYKIHNNLAYKLTSNSFALWAIEPSQPRYGDAQVYFVNNTGDNNFLLRGVQSAPLGYDGVYCYNNLFFGVNNTTGPGLPDGIEFTNNFIVERDLPGNFTGHPDIKNWIPNPTSPLVDTGIQVSGITTVLEPDIGWIEGGDAFIWGGAIEEDVDNLVTTYDQFSKKLVIKTTIPGTSLSEDVRIKITSNEYSIDGRILNPDHSVNHYHKIFENGSVVVEISFDGGITYEFLTIIDIPILFNSLAYVEGNQLVIKGGGYFTRPYKTLNIKMDSLTILGSYAILNVDTTAISPQEVNSIRVINRIDNKSLSYWMEDINTTNRKFTPIHLDMKGIQLNEEGGVDVDIIYGDGQLLPQPTLFNINPDINNLIFSGNPLLWFKSHSYIPNSGANETLTTWPSYNNQTYSFTQANASYKPTYEENSLNGWPGIRFNVDSILGPNLGNGDYTVIVIYNSEDNPDVSQARLVSGGAPTEFDWTTGIQLLTVNDANSRQVPGVHVSSLTYTGRDFDSITLGCNYRNPAGANFKGYLYEVIIIQNSLLSNTDRTKIRDYLRSKYGIYPQPSISAITNSNPISVQLGNTIYDGSLVTFIGEDEVRIPYNGEVGTYQLTVTNPNEEFATIQATFNYMEVLHNNLILLSADQINFGSTYLGTAKSEIITIKNTSTADDLILSNLIVPTGYSLVDTFPTLILPDSEASFTIQLDANTAGVHAGALTFETNDVPNFTINLNGEVVVSGIEVSKDPGTLIPPGDTLTFPNSIQGDNVSASFTLTNNGTGDLVIDNFVIDSPEFSNVTVFPVTIAPNTFQSFDIGLNTTTIGTKTGLLSFTTNDPNHPTYSFNLSALVEEALAPVLEISYLGLPITEGQLINLGSTSLGTPLTFSLNFTNTGTANLTPSDITVPQGYTLLSPLPTIAPNESALIEVQLEAAIKGTYPGTVSITYNPTITFDVVGVVTAPVISIPSGHLLDFGTLEINEVNNITETLVISNTGDQDLILNSITIPTGYSINPLVFPYTLLPTESISLDVTIDTSTAGSYVGDILVDSNDTITPVFTIAVTGIITAPSLEVSYLTNPITNGYVLDYGQYELNSIIDITKTLVLTNDGNQDLVIDSISLPIGYNAAPIVFPLTLLPTETLNLDVTLDTSVAGTYAGDVSINSNDVDNPLFLISLTSLVTSPVLEVIHLGTPIAPNYLLDYGSLEKDSTLNVTQTLTLNNNGDQDLVISSVGLPIGYSINPLVFPVNITPGSFLNLDVTIDTSVIGTYPGTISIVSNDVVNPTFPISTTGIITAPVIEVSYLGNPLTSPASLNYGQLELYETLNVSKTLVIENKGNVDLTLSSISLPTGYSSNALVLPHTLAPNETLDVIVTLDTSVGGTYTGDVLIDSDDENTPFVISLTGVVTSPLLTVSYLTNPITSGYLLDYGQYELNSSTDITKTLVLTNEGDQDFNLTSISLPNGYTTNPIVYPYVITPGTSLNVDVTLNTSLAGTYSGDIQITDDDINTPVFIVSVTALVTAPVLEISYLGTPLANSNLLDYGNLELNAIADISKVLTLTNIGNQDLVLNNISLPTGYSINPLTFPITIVPTGTFDVTVTLDTSIPGTYSGPTIFDSNDVDFPTFVLNTTGIVTSSDIEVSHLGTPVLEGDTIDFGSIEEDSNVGNIQTITISNPGNQDLIISSITLPTGYSTFSPFPQTVLSTGSVDIPIILSTVTPGTYSGQATIFSDAYGNPEFIFNLTGIITPIPVIEVSHLGSLIPSGYVADYGSKELNSSTDITKTFVIENTGSADLVLSSINVPLGYSIPTLAFPYSILPNDSLSLDVTLDTSQGGTYSGDVLITSNDGDTPAFTISLTALVTSPVIEVSYLGTPIASNYLLDYGDLDLNATVDVSKVVTIGNVGNQDLVISSVNLPLGYSTGPLLLPITLTPTSTFDLTLTLATDTPGTFSGPVEIVSDDPDLPIFILNTTGIITSPLLEVSYLGSIIPNNHLIEGEVNLNSSSSISLVYSNTGNESLFISSVSLPTGYSIPPLVFPYEVLPNTSLDLIVTIDTSTIGTYIGSVELNSNDVLNPIFITNLDFTVTSSIIEVHYSGSIIPDGHTLNYGELELNTVLGNVKTLTIGNTGNDDLIIDSITVPTGYTVSPLTYPYVLIPGSTVDVAVTLATGVPGVYSGPIEINSNDITTPLFTINTTGTITSSDIEVSHLGTVIPEGHVVDFGTVQEGGVSSQILSISNPGNQDLIIDSLALPLGYSLGSPILPITVPPLGSTDVVINLDTSIPNTYSGQATVFSDAYGNPEFIFNLTAIVTPIPPILEIEYLGTPLIDGDILDYAELELNSSVGNVKTLTLFNNGNQDLIIDSLTVPTGFNTDIISFPLTIAPSSNATVEVTLDTSAPGVYTGPLTISSNDPATPLLVLNLTGTVTASDIEVSHLGFPIVGGYTVPFGSIEKDSSTGNIQNLTISNPGTQDLIVSSITLPAGYSTDLVFPLTIAPLGLIQVPITLATNTVGNFSGQGIINSDAYGNPQFVFNLTGEIVAPVIQVSHLGAPIISGYVLDYGSLELNSTTDITKPLIISNEGDADLTIDSITVPPGYTVNNLTYPYVLTPGTSVTLDVTLDTSVGGTYTGDLVVNSNDGDTPVFIVDLTAVVTNPLLEVSYLGSIIPNNSVISQTVNINSTASKTFVLSNQGTQLLVVSSISLPVGYSATLPTFPLEILPTDSFSLDISLDTSAIGTYAGPIQITSDDVTHPLFTINASFTVTSSVIEVSHSGSPIPNGYSLDFGEIDFNSTTGNVQALNITNTGNDDLIITSITAPAGFTLSNITYPSTITPGSNLQVLVTLPTDVAGTYSGPININSNDPNLPVFIVNTTGTITYSDIEVSHLGSVIPEGYTIDYGEVEENTSAIQTITINNPGNQVLIVSSITAPTGYLIDPLTFPLTLAPLGSLDIPITLDTSVAGTFSGEVVISSDAFDNPQFKFLVTGIVTLIPPTLEVTYLGSPVIEGQVFDYGELEVNTVHGLDFHLTLSNSGSEDLIIDSTTLPTGYTLTPSVFPLLILPGASEGVIISIGSDTPGTYQGPFTIASNDPNLPILTLSLIGTITSSDIEVSHLGTPVLEGDTIDFGSIEEDSNVGNIQTITITNPGNQGLVISSITLPSGYSTDYFFPLFVSSGQSIDIPLTLNTDIPGTYSGPVVITTDAYGNLEFNLLVNGTIIPTPPTLEIEYENNPIVNGDTLDFGDLELNSPGNTQTLTLNNTGSEDLVINSITLPGGYTVEPSTLPITILPGQTLDLVLTLANDTPGDYQGPIVINTNDPNSPLTLNAMGSITAPSIELSHLAVTIPEQYIVTFGEVVEGATAGNIQTIVIHNVGNQNLSVSSITLPTGYSIPAYNYPMVIAPSGVFNIPITLSTVTPGDYQGPVTITSDAYDNPEFILNLTGTVIPDVPELAISYLGGPIYNGAIIPFGTVALNEVSQVSQLIRFTNTGTQPLLIDSITVPQGYYINHVDLPFTLMPGWSIGLDSTITLDTSIPGDYNGALTLTTNDPNNPIVNLNLTGSVLGPILSIEAEGVPLVSNDTLDFGEIEIDSTIGNSKVLNITNTGNEDLVISSITLPFGYSSDAPALPHNLIPGSVLNLTVTLDTATLGDYPGTLVVGSNVGSDFNIVLTGEIIDVPVPEIQVEYLTNSIASGYTIDYGSLGFGDTANITKSLVITNIGNLDLAIDSLIVPTGYSTQSLTFPQVLIPNGILNLDITLDSSVEGNFSGDVVISSNDIDTPNFIVSLTGIILPPTPELTIKKDGIVLSTGTYLDLGTTNILVPLSTNLELVNTGTGDLTISSIVLPNGFSTDLFTPVILVPNEALSVSLTLDAWGVGIYAGNLEVHNDDVLTPYLLSIYGEVLGVPAILLTHEGIPVTGSIDYGLIPLNTTGGISDKVFTITNEGTATLTLNNLLLPNGFVLTGPFPTSLEPNISVDFTLSIDTSVLSTYTGAVSFDTNTPSNVTFDITGTVYSSELIIKKEGLILINNSTVDLGQVVIPNQSTVTLELSNEGTVSIFLSNLVISSPFTSSLPTEIAPGGTQQLTITMASGVGNNYTGTISFDSTDTSNPSHTFDLIGTVLEPYFELSVFSEGIQIYEGDTLEFGLTADNVAVSKPLLLRNTGNTTLNITGVSLPTGYNYTGTNTFTLDPNEELTASVELLSGTEGIYQGQVSLDFFNFFVNGEVYLVIEPEIEITYEGQPLTPATVIAFGSTPYEEPLIKTLTITNPGNGDLILDDFVLPAGYSYSGTQPLVISPGDTVDIEIQSDATIPGASNEVISFSTNVPATPYIAFPVTGEVLAGELEIIYEGNPLQPNTLLQYGDIYLGQPSIKSLILNNTGTYPINVLSVDLPNGYSYIPALPIVIQPGSTSTLNIQLDASALGDHLGQLVINTDTPNPSFIAYLEGKVNEVPFTLLKVHSEGQLIQGALDLGTITKGSVITKVLNLSNLGNEDLTLTSILLDSAVFDITYPGLPIVLGTPVEVTLEAGSDIPGTYTGELKLIDSGGLETLVTLSLLVEGAALEITYDSNPLVSGDTVPFGSIYKDKPSIVRSITFTNSGNISLDDLTLDLDSTAYSVLTPITSIAPGESLTVDIALATTEEGIKNLTLSISGTSLFNKTLNLQGEILPPLLPQILVEPTGSITLPLDTPVDITLTNNSPYPITIDSLDPSIPGITTTLPLPITLAPGQSVVIPVIYEANSPTVGDITLSLPISGTIGDNPFSKTVVLPASTVPALPTVISIGATDPLPIGDNVSPITITSIPESITLKLGDTSVTEGQVLTPGELNNLTVFSISPGEYQIEYELNGTPQILNLAVETGPLLPVNNETGYIPIPKYEGLYPTSPYWIEGNTYWMLVEPTMALSTTPKPPSIPPANLVLDTEAKDKEPQWRNNKPLTVVQGETTVYMVGTIDKGLFDTATSTRDIFVYYSTIPVMVMEINGIIFNSTNLNIDGVTYSFNLVPGIIRVTITPNSITILNNGIVKRVVATPILWLPKGSIYTLKATDNGTMQDLLVTVDDASLLIDSYMNRKYLEGGDYISLLSNI